MSLARRHKSFHYLYLSLVQLLVFAFSTVTLVDVLYFSPRSAKLSKQRQNHPKSPASDVTEWHVSTWMVARSYNLRRSHVHNLYLVLPLSLTQPHAHHILAEGPIKHGISRLLFSSPYTSKEAWQTFNHSLSNSYSRINDTIVTNLNSQTLKRSLWKNSKSSKDSNILSWMLQFSHNFQLCFANIHYAAAIFIPLNR